MSTYKIAVIVGSLREESLNLKAAKAMMAVAPASLSLELVPIGELPLYNDDLEKTLPEQWKVFREKIKSVDGVVFVTPEYNRSVPGVLKNAIDVASRPYGKNAWDGKPAVVVSVSPGAMGGFGANHHLRQSLVFVNVPVLQQPEAYIGGASKLFDEAGNLVNDSTKDFLKKILTAYEEWLDTCLKKPVEAV